MMHCLQIICGHCGYAAPPCFCWLRSCLPCLLIATFAPMCAARCQSLGSLPSLPALHKKRLIPRPLSRRWPSCTSKPIALLPDRWDPSVAFMASCCCCVHLPLCPLRKKCHDDTLCLDDHPRRMGSVLALIFRFASPGRLCP
jgi:hypothetical protein